MREHALVGGGPDWGGYAWVAGVLRSLLPRVVELGAASTVEVGVETLAGRLRAEFEREARWGCGRRSSTPGRASPRRWGLRCGRAGPMSQGGRAWRMSNRPESANATRSAGVRTTSPGAPGGGALVPGARSGIRVVEATMFQNGPVAGAT
jgi:hypothetical protein